VVDCGTSEHGTATENPNAGGPFDSRRERRSFALGYRCEYPNGRSPRMLVRRQRDEGIRGLPRTLQYHPTKALNFAQQLHLGQVS
jgi:hypothetical protein